MDLLTQCQLVEVLFERLHQTGSVCDTQEFVQRRPLSLSGGFRKR